MSPSHGKCCCMSCRHIESLHHPGNPRGPGKPRGARLLSSQAPLIPLGAHAVNLGTRYLLCPWLALLIALMPVSAALFASSPVHGSAGGCAMADTHSHADLHGHTRMVETAMEGGCEHCGSPCPGACPGCCLGCAAGMPPATADGLVPRHAELTIGFRSPPPGAMPDGQYRPPKTTTS